MKHQHETPDSEEMEQPPVTWKEVTAGTSVEGSLNEVAEYLKQVSTALSRISREIKKDSAIDLTQLLKDLHFAEMVVELMHSAITTAFSTRVQEMDHPVSKFLLYQKRRAVRAERLIRDQPDEEDEDDEDLHP